MSSAPNAASHWKSAFRWLPGLALVLVIGAVSALVLSVRPIDSYAVRDAEYTIVKAGARKFDPQTFVALAPQTLVLPNALWQKTELPRVVPLPPSVESPELAEVEQILVRFKYRVDDSSAGAPLAVYGTRLQGGAYAVWANGRLVNIALQNWKMQFNTPLLVQLPIELARAGQEIEVVVGLPYRAKEGYAIGSLYVGPHWPLADTRNVRNFFQYTAPLIATFVMLLMGGIGLHHWLNSRNPTQLYMGLASIAFFMTNVAFLFDISDNATISQWYGSLVDSAITWNLAMSYFFGFRFQKQQFPRLEKVIIAITVLITLVTLPLWGWERNALVLQHYINVTLALGLSCLLTFLSFKRGSTLEFRLVTVALWSWIVFGIHDVFFMTSQMAPDRMYFFPYGTVLLSATFIFALQRENLRAFHDVQNAKAVLELRLAEREEEVRKQQLLLGEAEKSRTLLLERQRLVRDMHDGIGSSLMTSLAVVQRGAVTPDLIATVLRECLDDLKLVIESLEPVENDVVTLLGSLRLRLGPRLKQAGIDLIWRADSVPLLPWLQPAQALHVLRIVQEALSNAVKHACATEIVLSVSKLHTSDTTGTESVSVRVEDNGVGFDPALAQAKGRGLTNLQTRAAQIGGTLSVEKASPVGGTRVTLVLPVDNPSQLVA